MNVFEVLKEQYQNKLLKTKQLKREQFYSLKEELKTHNLVLIGLRQVGKTTLAEQLVKEYIGSDLSNDAFYYMNIKSLGQFDNQEFIKYITDNKFRIVFLDEIQMIKSWTNFAQVLIDLNPHKKFIFTGSNADALSKESMVNRTKVHFINPLTFKEFKEFWNSDSIDEYLKFGSYPKFDKYDSCELQYREIVDEQIIDKVISQDASIKVTPSKFKSLMSDIANYVGNELKVKKLESPEISRPTVVNYLSLLESSRLVSRIWRNNDKSDKPIGKAYFTDKSMLYRFKNYESLNANEIGSLIENLVFCYLESKFFSFQSISKRIEYFVGENRQEIDFVIDHAKIIVEVKYHKNVNTEELSKNLNKTLNGAKSDFRKIVITKNNDVDNKNGWKFISLEKILRNGIDEILK